MENASTTWVGLDAHKKFIQVAIQRPGDALEEWRVPYTPRDVKRLVRKSTKNADGPVRLCYEAGPLGFELQRRIHAAAKDADVRCAVIAPSLIPKKPGDRIKTDRKDARQLCELFRAGLLTEVHAPTEADESVRDLCRARGAAKKDLNSARHRLSKLLLRRGRIYTNGRPWTQKHRVWLNALCFEAPVDTVVFNDHLLAIDQIEARVRSLDGAIAELAQLEPYAERVGWLRCFHGIDTLSALTLLAEIHDFRRFDHPRQLMSYLGLTPSEHSSAGESRKGAITKAGNSRVRRLLVEAAWHYRHRPRVGKALAKRRQGQSPRVIAVADKAHKRLYGRYQRLTVGSRKPPNKAVVAVARELVGFLWAVLREPVA
ncbi:MAG: IS110 family transposase [Gemmatimonadota bacterium]